MDGISKKCVTLDESKERGRERNERRDRVDFWVVSLNKWLTDRWLTGRVTAGIQLPVVSVATDWTVSGKQNRRADRK